MRDFRSIAILLLLLATPALARAQTVGETAQSPLARDVQREAPAGAAISVEPMARINARIGNRVQSRIRNRLDRYYDPQANAASPFEVAQDQARSSTRSMRR